MSKSQNKQVVHVGAGIPPLSAYAFLGVSGSATLKGFYLDSKGRQVGVGRTFSISAGSGTADPLQFTNIPDGAVGFLGDLSADVYWSTGAEDAVLLADLKANYATVYPTLAGDDGLYFGAVSVD